VESYARILEEIANAPHVTVDPVHGRDGLWGVSLVANMHYFFVPFKEQAQWDELLAAITKKTIVTYDVRRIIDWPLSPDIPVADVKLFWGGDRALGKVIREEHRDDLEPCRRFLELDQKVLAHARAAKTAKMNGMPVTEVIPPQLLADWVKARVLSVNKLYNTSTISSGPDGVLSADTEERWKFILALRQVELAGIKVDTDFIERRLPDATTAEASCLRSMQGLQKNSYVTTLLNPIGTKTGRLRYEGGFNSLGIPNGEARKAIVSRHEGGLIYTFDFNAIDYRCIVRSIGGEFAKLYETADDFHERTASFLFKEVTPMRRKLLKAISYAYIYGGSVDTIVQTTGLEKKLVELALAKLDENIRPIAEFREALHMQAQDEKFVEPPGGKKVYVSSDDHPGKVLGLYAQTYSSYVFERAFEAVHSYLKPTKSCIIFSVYDELVLDMHPDDFQEAEKIRDIMQGSAGGGWKVKIKKGKSYGEQDQ
jgi:hypothetical protein